MRNNVLRYILDFISLIIVILSSFAATAVFFTWKGYLKPEFVKFDSVTGSFMVAVVFFALCFISFINLRIRRMDREREKNIEELLAGQLNLASNHNGTLSEMMTEQAVYKMLANPLQFEIVLSHLAHHTKKKILSTLVSIHAIEVQQIAAASNVPFGTAQYERVNKWVQSGRELNLAADQLAKLLGEKGFITSHTGSRHQKPPATETGGVSHEYQSGPGITQ